MTAPLPPRRSRPGPAPLAALLWLLVALPAEARPLSAGQDCGPDAFSSAQVTEGRPPRRGPLTAVPDTLCADLAPQGAPTSVDIHLYPGLGASVGSRPPGDPYEGRPPRPSPRP
ncbi:hypothetical protein [Methylobacterium sp. Leaf118]|uniref:hypothetical protein n=1 Tax=Methylobacterium sp. Leaf118 TaxID=2876562 RepID=UPI001E2BF341|nr:hypothetical protein [Methylobacterium sp. Leaf118]